MGNPVPRQRSVRHTVLIALLVCVGYLVGAEFAHLLRIPSTRSSIIWVPNAVLLAALLLTPPRFWAIWVLAALPAHLVAQSRDGGPLLVLLYPFFANVAQAIAAAMGLRWFACAPPRFNTLRDMTLFVLIAAITAPALISFLAAWLFVAVGWETDSWLVSRGRFLNNMTTSLTVAPLILMAAEGGLAGLRRLRVQRYVEFALLAVGLVGTLYLAHSWTPVGGRSIPVQLYAPLPFLLWAAVRFGPGSLCLSLLAVATHFIAETISGRGPYVAQSPAENVLALQISLAVLAIPLMFVAALIGERRKKEEALEESEERYRAIVEDQTEMICRWLPDATLTFVNQAYCRYFGKTSQELIGTSYVSLIPEADREAVEAHIASVIASVSEANPISTCEHSVVLASGEIRWQQWTDRGIFDAQGRLVGFQSVGRDITDRKRAERRHNAQYAVAQVLAESGSLRNAVSPLLRAICEGIGWQVGELWYVDPAPNVLRWGGLWHAPFVEVAEFEAISRATTFAPGDGLPGRVWASGEPTWIPDVRTDAGFIRASVAAKVGLHSALAFPIQGDREVTGVMVFFSRHILQPDPELLWTMFDIGGRIGQFMERKRAEEALRDSEERYRTLVEYSPAAILVHDLESGRYVDCNQNAIDLFGLDRDRLLAVGPEGVSPRLQPDGTPSEEKLRAATARGLTGDRLEYEYTFVNAAGQEIPCDVRVVRLPVKDRILLRSSIINIADRKRAEEALEKHHAFLKQVIDVDPNFIFAKDREGRFTLVNQAVADAYGTTVEDLIGKTDADFNPSIDEVELFRRMDLEVMDTLQERFIEEERMTDAQGSVRWLQTVKRPIVGEDGAANQVLGSATDITRRKRAEEELRARESALRDSQKDLQDLAGKLLTAQEEERRRLARELHDDLTQRLAVLAIEAGRLEQQLHGAAGPVLERLRHMKEQIVKLSADVHGISRQLHPSILDDLGLVSAMESECANLTQREGIAVKYESHNVPPTLPRDVALCLYRIAQEALWNIAKHAKTTEAYVALVGTDDAITLSVWDDGVGFDSTQLHRKPGLGLASMEERVRLIRGELSVKSEPGRGTEIEVMVPLGRV